MLLLPPVVLMVGLLVLVLAEAGQGGFCSSCPWPNRVARVAVGQQRRLRARSRVLGRLLAVGRATSQAASFCI